MSAEARVPTLNLHGLCETLAASASAAAVYFDLRARRIPNRLTYATAIVALALACLAASQAGTLRVLASSLLGGLTLLTLFGVLSVRGLLGFGDTKLLCAIGLCVGLPTSLRIAVCVLLSGGLLAVAYALWQGQVQAMLGNLLRPNRLRSAPVSEPQRHLHLFGYAPAIALGTGWVLLGLHYPALLPL